MFWEKAVLVLELLRHPVQVFCQVVLAGELLDVGARVSALARSQFADAIGRDPHVRPVNDPVAVLSCSHRVSITLQWHFAVHRTSRCFVVLGGFFLHLSLISSSVPLQSGLLIRAPSSQESSRALGAACSFCFYY
jgi:hypothetical protein